MKITVVILDTWQTISAINCLGEALPFGKRSVQIELTPEQKKQLELREVGESGVNKVYEQYGSCWIEPESKGGAS